MSSSRFLVVMLLLAAGVFAGVWALLHAGARAAQRDAAILASLSENTSRPGLLPIVEVERSLRALKLVTVEVRTTVESQRLDESWRGDVAASVSAPATLYYGCDLSNIGMGIGPGGAESWLRRNLLADGFMLRVPRPMRLAAEIEGEREQSQVAVGWGRFRDVAGEYQLGLARMALHVRARQMVLTAEREREIEQTTREQLTTLVRALAAGGRDVPVEIEFYQVQSPHGVTVGGASVDAPTDGDHR